LLKYTTNTSCQVLLQKKLTKRREKSNRSNHKTFLQ
jgi:hypothetical protein